LTSRAELLLSIAGRTDAYGEEQPDGSYRIVYEPLTRKVLESHLAGRRNIGVFLVSPEGSVRCGVFAIRERSKGARQAVVKLKGWLEQRGLFVLVEDMAEDGYRVWMLLQSFMPAWQVAKVLQIAVGQIGDSGVPIETFPSCDEVERLGFWLEGER
jgi:hypothetical protein